MITLPAFIKLFSKNDHNISKGFKFFFKNATVISGKTIYSLKDYVEKKNIKISDLLILFENIKHKNEYLARFYKTSLFYDRDDISIDEIPMKNHHFNNNSLVQYKNVIRNTFFYEILRDTKSGFNNPSYLEVVDALYNHYNIYVNLLAPSSLDFIKKGRIASVFSSLFFRASIMNPYLVFSLNKSAFREAKSVFTPTLGWGSYYYGFAESGVEEYVGVDVIPNVCSKVIKFSEKYYPHVKTDIYCTPSESLLTNVRFLRKYKNHFDVIFFSPPYFMLEKYPGKNQSTVMYDTLEEWLEKYWEKTIQLCSIVLKEGGTLSYILSDYGSKNNNNYFALVKLMNDICKKYFKTQHMQKMHNKNVMVTGARHRETNEKIMMFSNYQKT